MKINKEFEFSNLYYLNGTNVNNKMSSADLMAIDESRGINNTMNDVIQIYDSENDTNPISYTYAKFIETLAEYGLSGFVTA